MPSEALLWWLSALPTLILLPLALTAVALLVRAVLRGEDAAGDPRRARPPLGLLSPQATCRAASRSDATTACTSPRTPSRT